jgi:hypothetical protein
VARADEFTPSFFSTYFDPPIWLSQILLYKLDISGIMRALRAFPLRQAHPVTTLQAFRDLLSLRGDVELGSVCEESWLIKCSDALKIELGAIKSMKISNFLSCHHIKILRQEAGISMFRAAEYHGMRLFQTSIVESQLEYFTDLLRQGKIVFLSPEGKLSPDGKLCAFRGILNPLAKIQGINVKILPLAISYDFITTGRKRIFLNIGKEITTDKGLSKNELDNLVSKYLRKLAVVTMSQLGGYVLFQEALNGTDFLEKEIWQNKLIALFEKAENNGFELDQSLFSEQVFYRKICNFEKYCIQKGLLTRGPQERILINHPQILDTSTSGYSKNPIYYCYNEFKALLGTNLLT